MLDPRTTPPPKSVGKKKKRRKKEQNLTVNGCQRKMEKKYAGLSELESELTTTMKRGK